MEVAGTLEKDDTPLREVEENVKSHYDNPERIVWGEQITKHHYATVHLDGVEYQVCLLFSLKFLADVFFIGGRGCYGHAAEGLVL